MLFPQEKRTPTETPAASQPQAPQYQTPPQYQAPAPSAPSAQPIIVQAPGSGLKIPILFGAVLALLGACIYLYYQLNQMRSDMADMKDSLSAEIAKLSESSAVSNQTSRHNIENLEKELAKARAQATQLSGEAKSAATAHADELAARLQKAQDEQGKQIASVGNEVTSVRTEATNKIGAVSADVAVVRTDQAKTRSDLEKTIADLKSARGDLGVQSGLIATNGKELAALKALGERNYTDFKIVKTKHEKPQKVGDLQVLLEKADPKHNLYTIKVIADDKTVEKKDRSINEPVQFMLSRATQPYELVVNDIKKDMIIGYVSAPKVQQSRAQANP
ncbi:MAG TPA: hypothetical protein VMG40_08245 [Bryobacteraceae bacterium]|nr:hypothetical protein [Bryobacteraceae bacterium]